VTQAINSPATRNVMDGVPSRGTTTSWDEGMEASTNRNLATRLIEDFELHRTVPDERPAGPLPEVPGFELLDVLGEGGMGIVYKARNVALKRLVALKMIAPEHSGPNSRRRFQREAETVARLQHPNIVQIYEVGEHEGRPFLSLELIEDGTLAQYLAKFGPMPARDAALLVAVVARAMHYAHECNVVHRDLKPSNILLHQPDERSQASSRDDTEPEAVLQPTRLPIPKVTDFGLARMLDAGQDHTKTGAILGTPAYMAPEQAAGCGDVIGPRTDIYSLGTLLYEALTGRPPFSGESSWDVLIQIIHTDPTPPSKLRPQLSRDLDTVCLKALAKHPLDRYATAAALADDLERFAAGEAIAARPESRASRFVRRLRRHPIKLAAAIVTGGLLVGGGLYSWHVRAETRRGLDEGRAFLAKGSYQEAALRFQQASRFAGHWPVARDLQRELNAEWRAVRRQQIGAELHVLADQLRFWFDPDSLTSREQAALATQCRRVWDAREDVLAFRDIEANPEWQNAIQADLLDVALLSTNLRVRLATGESVVAAHEEALTTLQQIETLYGPSLAVALERQQHEKALQKPVTPIPTDLKPRSAWDYYLFGRTLLIAARAKEDYTEAARLLTQASKMNRKETIFMFTAGRAALSDGNYGQAEKLFSTCIALADKNLDVCYYNHGLALFHQNVKATEALMNFDAAIGLNDRFAAAWLNRGLVHHQRGNSKDAISDLIKALELGAEPALVHYNLAVVYEAKKDVASARRHAAEALLAKPDYPAARELQKRLAKL